MNSTIHHLKQFLKKKRVLLLSIILLSSGVSVQQLLLGKKQFHEGGKSYFHYNNYVIFAKSFEHLKANKALYQSYEEYWDLYKYSPSFAVLFAPMSLMPNWAGLTIWNLINALALFFAIYYLPKIPDWKKGFILIICLIELIISLQNSQSNGLVAGLLIFSFGLLERKKLFWAAFCIVLSAYIKLFGIVAFALFLFYPGKIRAALYSFFWLILFGILPLLFLDPDQYLMQLQSWAELLQSDHTASQGLSVLGWLNSWFGVRPDKFLILFAGGILLLLPYLRIKQYGNYRFRIGNLASLLIWVVIFNHKAESPTFIIALSGVAIAYAYRAKNATDHILLAMVLIFTSLSSTDIIPHFIRDEFIKPYSLKTFPCILAWIKINYDLYSVKGLKKVSSEGS